MLRRNSQYLRHKCGAGFITYVYPFVFTFSIHNVILSNSNEDVSCPMSAMAYRISNATPYSACMMCVPVAFHFPLSDLAFGVNSCCLSSFSRKSYISLDPCLQHSCQPLSFVIAAWINPARPWDCSSSTLTADTLCHSTVGMIYQCLVSHDSRSFPGGVISKGKISVVVR